MTAIVTTPDTETLAKEVLRIQERDGVCSPRVLVAEAADPAHVLHNAFPWDDALAANEYRVYLARRMIARVKVVRQDVPAPAFVHTVIVRGNDVREGYVPIDVALSDADMRQRTIREAVAGVSGWRDRLNGIQTAEAARKHLDEAVALLTDLIDKNADARRDSR